MFFLFYITCLLRVHDLVYNPELPADRKTKHSAKRAKEKRKNSGRKNPRQTGSPVENKPRSPSLRGLMDFFGLVSTGSLADAQNRCGGLASTPPHSNIYHEGERLRGPGRAAPGRPQRSLTSPLRTPRCRVSGSGFEGEMSRSHPAFTCPPASSTDQPRQVLSRIGDAADEAAHDRSTSTPDLLFA